MPTSQGTRRRSGPYSVDVAIFVHPVSLPTHCTTRTHGQFEKGDTQIIPTESACAANASDQRGDPIRRDRSPGHGNFTRTDESVSNLVSGEISVRKARSHHRPQTTHGPARPVAEHFSRYPEGIRKKIVEDHGTSPRPPHSAKKPAAPASKSFARIT